jgi:FMN phosphatase YigB (HAD superfamily)
MKIHYLPDTISALIFDIDLTLYINDEYEASQPRILIERLAGRDGKTTEEVEAAIESYRSMEEQRTGNRPTFTAAMTNMGVDIQQNAQWREEGYTPEEYLEPDNRLREALLAFKERYRIAAVTNNATAIGFRTLHALGIDDLFEHVIGLDITGEPKPTMKPFQVIAEKFGLPLEEMVSIGDRAHVDVELPVEHGMGGILVDGPDDIIVELPKVLLNHYSR